MTEEHLRIAMKMAALVEEHPELQALIDTMKIVTERYHAMQARHDELLAACEVAYLYINGDGSKFSERNFTAVAYQLRQAIAKAKGE